MLLLILYLSPSRLTETEQAVPWLLQVESPRHSLGLPDRQKYFRETRCGTISSAELFRGATEPRALLAFRLMAGPETSQQSEVKFFSRYAHISRRLGRPHYLLVTSFAPACRRKASFLINSKTGRSHILFIGLYFVQIDFNYL